MKKRQKALAVLILLLIAFLAAGCKPQQIVTEKIVAVTDSTAIAHLTNEVSKKERAIEALTADLKKTREENNRLLIESLTHRIDYDIGGQINPETGEYPKASETKTESKYLLEQTIKEMEVLKIEHNREVKILETKISNLELIVQTLSQENSALKVKETPTFNFKSFAWGVVAGIALMILLFIFLRR